MPTGVYIHSEESKRKVSSIMKGRKKTEEHRMNIKKNHADNSGIKHPNYNKFGVDTTGWNPKSNHRTFLRIHSRRTMEKKLGRKLSSTEIVHHIDHNRMNNNPDNLHLFENTSKHSKYHCFLRGLVKSLLTPEEVKEYNSRHGIRYGGELDGRTQSKYKIVC